MPSDESARRLACPPYRFEETPKERTDRQLLELLNELRVALPGAQFLFAFLLAVPFAARFGDVSHGLQIVFYVCLLSTLAATILLMAPAVYHRIRWQQGNKTEVIRVAHRMFLAGMAALAVAMTTAVWFVSAFLFGTRESLDRGDAERRAARPDVVRVAAPRSRPRRRGE